MKKASRIILSLLLMMAFVFGSYTSKAEAHNKNQGYSSYSKRYSWGYYSYLKHTDVHKLIDIIEETSAAASLVGGAGFFVPSIPGKVVGTAEVLGGYTSFRIVKYLEKKDKGRGLKFKILKPNLYGWTPTKKYLIIGVYSR